MTKNEFMENLIKALSWVESSQRQEILADFEEHFSAGVLEGKSEAEICVQLGDPTQIAKQFAAEYKIEKAEQEPGTKNIVRAVFASMGLGFFNLIFVFGPFAGLCAVLFALYIAVLAISLSGVFSVIIVTASPFLKNIVYLGEGLDWLAVIFFSIGMTALGILLVSPLLKLTKWFYNLIIKYLKFNADIITGRRNRT